MPAAASPPPVAQRISQVQAFPEPIRVQDPAPGRGHALRNVSLGCVGLIALLIIIGVVANGANSTKRPTPQIDLSGRSSSRATVGGEDAVSFTA
jgi:hypothetical protein